MTSSTVAVLACGSYEPEDVSRALLRGFELLGGLRRFVRKGEKVLLKPNILAGCPPEQAVTTHPAVMEAMIRILLAAGAGISYGDSSGIVKPAQAARDSGLAAVAEGHGVTAGDFEHGSTPWPACSRNGRRYPIAKAVLEADAVFNLAKMKTHQLTRITGAVKNLFGCVPGLGKPALHARHPESMSFSHMLVELNLLVRPRLHVLDGVMAMEGNGPRNGEARAMNVLLMSEDPVAVDAVFCRLINLKPELVPTCLTGKEDGLGTYKQEEIELRGDGLGELVQRDFKVVRTGVSEDVLLKYNPVVRNLVVPRPVIDEERCAGCGICLKACPLPGKALRINGRGRGSPPVYDYDRCIRCYCCQEMCPRRAIRRVIPFLGRLLPGRRSGR